MSHPTSWPTVDNYTKSLNVEDTISAANAWTTLPLLSIILNADRRTKMGETLGNKATISTQSQSTSLASKELERGTSLGFCEIDQSWYLTHTR